MRLTILIPTLPSRAESLARLSASLESQGLQASEPAKRLQGGKYTITVHNYQYQTEDGKEHQVELITMMDNKQLTVGKKRNILKTLATGDYLTYLDDDDEVSNTYLARIFKATEQGADLITYGMEMYEDDRLIRKVRFDPKYNKDHDTPPSEKIDPEYAAAIEGKNKGAVTRITKRWPWTAHRIPNHLMVWKARLAIGCSFPDINLGEDGAWAIKMRGRIRSHHHIDEVLYRYKFSYQTTETQR